MSAATPTPTACPACHKQLPTPPKPHCQSKTCTWLRCSCGAWLETGSTRFIPPHKHS